VGGFSDAAKSPFSLEQKNDNDQFAIGGYGCAAECL
jgi:hypothetical protein